MEITHRTLKKKYHYTNTEETEARKCEQYRTITLVTHASEIVSNILPIILHKIEEVLTDVISSDLGKTKEHMKQP